MSRIFLSHSSADELEAVAIKHWMASNGWDDVFLDIDPERGLVAGERWQEALRRAAAHCEAVVFLISPAWAASKWCLAEFLLAKSFNKRIFGVLVKEVALSELPSEMTSEWQLCSLLGAGEKETITCTHREQSIAVSFLAEGLGRLQAGLLTAGLHAEFFPWPPEDDPKRSPYRGLEPLEALDAAVFFGRDLEILQGLDMLRSMRASAAENLFVILGASGAGKSSFLRAGLLPRLGRDSRHFLPLQPIRPERSPVYGERGLARAISEANKGLGLQPMTFGEVKSALREGKGARLLELLRNILAAGRAALVGLPAESPPPTLVLSVDQAEELFNADSRSAPGEVEEGRVFLELIGSVLHATQREDSLRGAIIVAFTIRSDRYEPLQTAPELSGLRTLVFDALKPMLPAQFKEVISGPARRAILSGQRLEISTDLVSQLLRDCNQQGGDTLPVLSMTLARLYRDYGSDGDLRLEEYEKGMGGMAKVIKGEAESILDVDLETRSAQLELLRNAFIPALVVINPDNDQPMRRVARLHDLPADSQPLVQALVDKRLLLSDLRGGEPVIEVAHESLFRQWDVLVTWLSEEKADLKDIVRLEQAVLAWQNSGRKDSWLMQGERLEIAEALAAKPRYSRRLESAHEFLVASRQRETRQREEEVRLRDEKLHAETIAREEAEKRQQEAEVAAMQAKAQARKLGFAVVGALLAFFCAAAFFVSAAIDRSKALTALRQANGLRLAGQGKEMWEGRSYGAGERALLQLIAAGRANSDTQVASALITTLWASSDVKKISMVGMKFDSTAFSPDGTRIVAGRSDGTLYLLDSQTLQPIRAPWQGHKGTVESVAFSPDGTRIVSAGDGTLRLWDAQSGKSISMSQEEIEAGYTSVAFSPNGQRIVSGGRDGTLHLWDARSGQPTGMPVQGHADRVRCLAFSPDGTRIVSGADDGKLHLWDAQSGQPIGMPLQGHDDWVRSVAFSPDSTLIVSGGDDGALRLWDANSGRQLLPPLYGHRRWVMSVAFSPDGTRVVSGGDDGTLRLWDVRSGQLIRMTLQGHEARVNSVAFSPDGTSILSGSDDGLYLWAAQSGQSIGMTLQGHDAWVRSVAFSPDGTRIVSGTDDGLHLWDVQSGKLISPPLWEHEAWVKSVAFSPDGTSIVSGSEFGLRLWDVRSGQPVWTSKEGREAGYTSVAFSPDGTRIVSAGGGGVLRLWDAQGGQPIGVPLLGHEGHVWSVAFSQDGTRIVSGGDDGTVRLWDAESGRPISTSQERHGTRYTSVVFSPDGKGIVSAGSDGVLRLWNAQSSRPVDTPIGGQGARASRVTFSPDGKYIVSGGDDGRLRLWEGRNGQPIGTPIGGGEANIRAVAFSPDGTHIVSGSDDALMISPAPKIWPDLLCAKLTRNMSRQEWIEWVSPELDYECQCPGLPIPPDDPASDVNSKICHSKDSNDG